jgi:hypothetical protein
MTASTRDRKDREWIGRVLFLLRQVNKLNRWGTQVCKSSVIRLINEMLPDDIIEAERLKEARKNAKRHRKDNESKGDNSGAP